jgi:acetyltransferase-like isoleucine patch superfamily enzyme
VAGSCSLITKSLEPWKIYLGIPAKLYKERQSSRILEMEATLRREIG